MSHERTDERAPDEEAAADGERGGGGFPLWMLIPALAALAVLGVFAAMLGREGAQDLPSTLIGRPAPEFVLPPLRPDDAEGLATAHLKTPGAKVVNIWASWCGPCRIEHPELERLAAMGVTVHGINYKDEAEDGLAFLDELGDPFARIGRDEGRVGIEWGVYGVPETFVLDGEGRIVYKHIGPIQNDDLERKILPAVREAEG